MKIGTDGVQLLGGHGFIREHIGRALVPQPARARHSRRLCDGVKDRDCSEQGEGDVMINLELSEQHAGADKMMREVAKNLLRPISRKYDKQEHDVPVELKVLDRRPPPRSPSAAPTRPPCAGQRARAQGAQEADDRAERREHGELRVGDADVLGRRRADAVGAGRGLGNAAINAVATPEQKERFGSYYASMAITEPAPAPTRARSARPRGSTATSG